MNLSGSENETTLRLAYSPDADDSFMFRAAIEGLIDSEGLTFLPSTANTEALNEQARSNPVDVTAISVASYPSLADDYLLLPHGGSIGRGYGPVIVARNRTTLDDLAHARIATPGPSTTAHLVTRLLLPDAELSTVPITPYEAIFSAVGGGEVDAGVIIHEGRLTFEDRGLSLVADIGQEWTARTGLPLPLGANVIRRDLGPEIIGTAVRVLRRSIAWALENRESMLDWILESGERPEEVNDRALLDRYLGMYANAETLAYRPDTKDAIVLLLEEARRLGFSDRLVRPEYAR